MSLKLYDDVYIQNQSTLIDELKKAIKETVKDFNLSNLDQIYAKSEPIYYNRDFTQVADAKAAYYKLFDIGFTHINGNKCFGFFIKAPKTKQGWRGLSWTTLETFKDEVLSQKPGNALRNWAFIPFPESLIKLKEKALQEKWCFGNSQEDPTGGYPILDSYLKNTFYRLSKLEEKEIKNYILETDSYAVFNTGLVDNFYDPIYAFFKKNRHGYKQPWNFDAFDTGKEGYGQTLRNKFEKLPKEAYYVKKGENEWMYDIEKGKPELKWNHILYEHTERLPWELIQKHWPKGLAKIDKEQLDKLTDIEKNNYFISIATALEADGENSRAIKFPIEKALEVTLKRVKWNRKTAIASYFPTLNSMNFLLPLCIISESRVDVALVVSKNSKGEYEGHSLLSLSQAYSNARLVSRPDSDWLDPTKISISSEGSEKTEEEQK